jgi:hypothetical protein
MSKTYNYRLPVKQELAQLPAPLWQQAAPVVLRGAALVAAGVIGEWLVRSATRKAVSMPFKKGRALDTRQPVIEAFEETIIVRRTRIRQK